MNPFRSIALTAAILLLTAAFVPAADTVPQVRLAYFPNVTHAAAIVGVARKTFADALGPKATLDVKPFAAGPALIEALFAGGTVAAR